MNFRTLLMLLVFLGLSFTLQAMTGKEVMEKVYQATNPDTQIQVSKMSIQRGDQKLIRSFTSYQKRFGEDKKGFIVFMQPAEVRGTKFLTWSYADSSREDDSWIYLPGSNLLRRIIGGGKKGSFMRSDFANEDMESREVDDSTHKLLGEEPCGESRCYVVESIPAEHIESGYQRWISYIRMDVQLPVRVDFYNRFNKQFKSLYYTGFVQTKGFWSPGKILMKNHQRGSHTLIVVQKNEINVPIEDRVFLHSNLKR